jgi:lauroyl/myristoyl acyltransferase
MSAPAPPAVAATPVAFYRPRLGRSAFQLRHAGSWLLVGVLWLCAWLPLSASRLLGAAMGLLMMAANRKRREIARINLALCFPERDERDRARLLRRHFITSGQALTDYGLLVFAPRRWARRKIRLRGLEHFRAHRGQRPVIFLAPHCVGAGFGGSLIASEYPSFSMFKAQRNPWADWLLNRGRMRFGGVMLNRAQGMRPVVKAIRGGYAFYYLPDEDFGEARSVFAPFFGVPRATLPTLGRLAQMTDAVVIPYFSRLLPGGRGYEVTLEPALTDFPSGDSVADATRMNAVLEAGLRRSPEQYLWTLKLFKTRPGKAASYYPERPRRARRHG